MKSTSRPIGRWLAILLLMTLSGPLSPPYLSAERTEELEALAVGLEIVRAQVPADQPFATPTHTRVSASGLVIGPNQILTDLSPVMDAVSVQVRRADGSTIPGSVQFRAFDAGLAIVSVLNPFGKHATIPAGTINIPAGATVDVYGRTPSGRSPQLQRLRVAGTVQRLLDGSDVDRRLLMLLDNSAEGSPEHFSGGPVFYKDRFVGVYHQGRPAYVLTAGLIAQVMEDIKDDRYDGIPTAGFSWQKLSNPTHRATLSMAADQHGVLVRRVLFNSGAWGILRSGDVLLSINTRPANEFGMFQNGDVRLTLEELIGGLTDGKVQADILRSGTKQSVSFPVSSYAGHNWRRRRARDERVYFMVAGLVFQELDYELIHSSDAGKDDLLRYRYDYFHTDGLSEQVDRDVVLSTTLSDPAIAGASSHRFGIVEYFNKRRVRSLAHLATEFKRSQDRFITLRFMNRSVPLVLEREKIPEINGRVFSRYRVRPGGSQEVPR